MCSKENTYDKPMTSTFQKKRSAFIDLGTNTLILLVADLFADGHHEVIQQEFDLVRLGEGLFETGLFSEEAFARTLTAIKKYKKICVDLNCDSIRLVGTAACRRASNTNDLITEIKKQTGIHLEVISGDEEARLIHAATMADFGHLKTPRLILDIGGGSTEFIFDLQPNLTKRKSLDFGSVKLFENTKPSDPMTETQANELKNFVAKSTKELLSEFNLEEKNLRPNVIATAGTPTTYLALHKQLKEYDASKIHGHNMSLHDLKQQIMRLQKMTTAERGQLNCLPPKRADIIVVAGLILESVLETLQCQEFWVSDQGLRFGLVQDELLSGIASSSLKTL
ncbi:MAG: Ppx/GppA family phosphatase [Deltaproteobacteria bacterium]|nr:Ppx/GppA family phosphatase [Deltaproteobacteria bacterium]